MLFSGSWEHFPLIGSVYNELIMALRVLLEPIVTNLWVFDVLIAGKPNNCQVHLFFDNTCVSITPVFL